jgi:hopanoid biosynthesis associated protein HpnK
VRRLIINADDFGLTLGVNRAIAEGHRGGIVTSATLMACGRQFEDAASLAKEMPRLSVGCHVVLVDGQPASSPKDVDSLLMPGASVKFRDSLFRFAARVATGSLDEGQIEAEVTAQIRRLQVAGIAVSHLDSHKHTHMFPAVLRGMVRAGKNCGVQAIRNPFEPLVFTKFARWKRQFQLRTMRSYRRHFHKSIEQAGMASHDGCIGVAVAGGLDEQAFRQLIENLPEGTWEFVSHPGYNDQELDQVRTRLRQSREKELAILTSDASREVLHREQVQVISYREL